ncbi:hypothetical protein [Kaistia nematophila]|uniref:Uncharacterized protein n=1 Tax=Kaistia nematophila TaxID=2994654 RepID=A0A9X3IKZ9_9HYPH|nr:hypothetical protein [Kaistia nematophila]MCX5568340.1 hypothetical protein [Kaistia nematophila]
MAAPTELKDSLQRISALMGLLRSDLLELSEARDVASRTPVVDHIHWIADQLDELGDGLSDDGRRRTPARPQRMARASQRSSAAKPSARGSSRHVGASHAASGHATSGHATPSHAKSGHEKSGPAKSGNAASSRTSLSTRRPARPDSAARPAPRRPAESHEASPPRDEAGASPAADTPPQKANPPEAAVTPPPPDVPSLPGGDDKLH